jgi:hypothetical protein
LVTVILKETTMKMWKVFRGHSVIALGLLVTVFIFASLANATTLAPGNLTGVAPTTGYTEAGGTIVGTALTDNYSFGSGDTGTVTEWVVSGDTNNTLGGLDFIYQVTVATVDISKINMGNYGSLTTNVATGTGAGCAACTGDAAGNLAPDVASNNGFGTITFGSTAFNTGTSKNLVAGQSSYLMYVLTNAPGSVAGYIGLIDSGSSPTLAGYAPSPEPGSVGLLLGGLFGLGLFVTRRFRVQQS